jgi:hypothetical protein
MKLNDLKAPGNMELFDQYDSSTINEYITEYQSIMHQSAIQGSTDSLVNMSLPSIRSSSLLNANSSMFQSQLRMDRASKQMYI